jgi:hypothetical protein
MDKKTFKQIMKLKDKEFMMYLRSRDACELFLWAGTHGKDPHIKAIVERGANIIRGYQEAVKWALGRSTK